MRGLSHTEYCGALRVVIAPVDISGQTQGAASAERGDCAGGGWCNVGGLSNTDCGEYGYRLRVRVQIAEWPFGVKVWKCPPDHARDTTDWGANVRGVCVERDGCTRADADAATAAAAQHFIRMLRVSLAFTRPSYSIHQHTSHIKHLPGTKAFSNRQQASRLNNK